MKSDVIYERPLHMPGVDFTNVLWPDFLLEDPKSANKTDNLTVFFTLLGSAHAKASRKMLVKLNPDLY